MHKQRQIRYYEQYLWVSSLDTPVSFPFRFLWSFKNMAKGRLSNNMAKGRKLYKFHDHELTFYQLIMLPKTILKLKSLQL